MSELTPKQRLFVAEYLKDLNATQAAIRAGYSEKTAHVQGPRLLDNVEVKSALNNAMDKRAEAVEVDAAYVLRRLHEMAEADIRDIYGDDGELLPVSEWPDVWRKGMISGIETNELFDGHGRDRVQIGHVRKVKQVDKLSVLQTLGKHVRVNAFQEQIKVTGLDALADRMARVKAKK